MTERQQDWLANLGQEIRTPMSGIIGMARLLLETPLRSDQRQCAESIHESAGRLLAMVESLLGDARHDTGPPRPETGDFDLPALIEGSAELLAPQAERKGLALGVYIHPAAILRLHGDAGRLRQVLVNIVANAIRFTARGSVEIDVRVHPLDADTVKLRVAVADSGIGIAPDIQARIFERFAQANAATGTSASGLGLALCRQMVEAMGGDIGVESEPGRGATFWFAVPIKLADGNVGLDLKAFEPLSGLRALVVDSYESDRRVLRRRLQALGLEVVEAPDPRGAIDALDAIVAQDNRFDLILLEQAGFTGPLRAVVERIARDDAARPPRIVLCTPFGTAATSLTHDALRTPDAVITKPFRVAAIAQTLLGLFATDAAASTADAASAAGTFVGQATQQGAARILVADDNRVNLRLMAAILEREGFGVDIAEDGVQAVELAARRGYAAILMDVKMPRMNGLEAAARIRALDGAIARVPIVALTANTTPRARELYLAAGMDEHVPKPVNRTELMAVLRRVVARPSTSLLAPTPRHALPQPAAILTDHPDLDEQQLSAVQSVLRKAEFERLIAAYAEGAQERADGLRAVAAIGDLAAMTRAAQDIGSIAANVGARRLKDLAAALETACRERRPEDADRITADVAAVATRTADELRRRFLRRAG
jgi:CheY-like chemotaxis protein/HPt (histidine-containing phosphotransfer) domain-containing protein/two-component sensor histidine kinase